ncbi:MAG TPA: sulfatase-like hydrolase/transferase [Vicinamibacteria bacterium]|nr:sulfatase-like hydrolase/transferase [Vicinamibacteria bacterium]
MAAALTALVVIWLLASALPRHRRAGPNVLLITIDTLRADAVGAYGASRASTPMLDRLAAGGVRFDNAHAHNVVTLPSIANILSGRYPHEHGVRDNSGFRFPAGSPTLATLLKERGYRTGAFVSAFPLASRFGLGRGFDVYDDSFVDRETRPAFLLQERRAPETVALAQRFMAQSREPFLCWVHLYEPHFPYEPPEPFASRFLDAPYLGEVAAADAALAPLLAPLLEAGASGRTLVVFTADHGESLGEHGESTHGIFAYEATLRVPLVLYQPSSVAPRVVIAPVRHVDLVPTILDALDLPVPAGLPGRSLVPLATGRPLDPAPSYFEALSGRLNRGWAPLHGVLHGGLKYIDLPVAELYDLASDPHETRNLAPSPRLEPMKVLLAPFRSADPGPARGRESRETEERLRSLGYIGGGPIKTKERFTEDDDPKRLIGLDGILQEVVSLYFSGDIGAALARCRELVRLRPDMALSLLHLAHLERESGHLDAAVAALRKALAADAENATAASLLGAYLTQAGRAEEAAALLEPYAQRDQPDLDVLFAQGLALAQLGRHAQALAVLERARDLDPANAMVLVHIGTVHLMARDGGRARSAFEAAVAMNPMIARGHSSLAVVAAEEGRVEEALGHFGRALELDPKESEPLLALGSLLWRKGRQTEARRYLELFVAKAPPSRYERELLGVRTWLAHNPPSG